MKDKTKPAFKFSIAKEETLIIPDSEMIQHILAYDFNTFFLLLN